jgi:Serpentine type 7TM GPCR chemoreceptor Str
VYGDLFSLVQSAIIYAIVIWCSVKTYRHVRQSVAAASSSASTINRAAVTQLSVVLVVLAVTPLVVEMVPAIVATTLTVGEQSALYASSLSTMIYPWAPLVNGLAVILVVGPYRREVWGRVSGGVKRNSAFNTGITGSSIKVAAR